MPNKSQKSNTHRQIDRLLENVSGLLSTQLQLFQLEARAEVSKLLGAIFVLTLFAFAGGMIALGLSIALTLFLGDLLGSNLYAVLLITALYILLLLWLWLRRKPLQEQFTDSIELQLDKLSLEAMLPKKEEGAAEENGIVPAAENGIQAKDVSTPEEKDK